MTPSLTVLLQIVGIAALVASVGAALHALLNKKDPRSALGWVALVMLSPVIGMVAYLVFGINRIRRKAKRIREERATVQTESRLIPGSLRSLERPMTGGNQVECLLNGTSTIQAVSRMIRQANKSIYLSVYIFESKGVGEWLINELGDAVNRGVDVRVLLDGVGSLYAGGGTRRRLTAAGVKVGVFLRPSLFPPAWHINLRNHRKMLVIDECEAIVGGTNVRNAYVIQEGHKEAEAKDVNFTLKGPIVDDVLSVFVDDWFTATEELIETREDGPTAAVTPANAECRATVDGPDNDVDLISLLYMAAISQAKRRVRIVTPYFLPPQELIATLQVAAIRGVRVEVVLPARNNLPFVHWAMRNMLPQLLKYGVHVYYQQGPFDHSKLFVVDDDYALVGSANVDARSLILNFEICVEIRSTDIAATLNQHIDGCLARSQVLDDSELSARSWPVKLRDAVFWLFTPYL